MSAERDLALLRRFEPVLRFTRGEHFFPMDVRPYVQRSSFWMQRPGEEAVRLIPEGEVTLERLAEPRHDGFGAVYYLKFIEPLNLPELAAYRLRQSLARREPQKVFHAGRGRLARVGYGSRFVDALFSLTLLARGRVPGDTAAAAAMTYERIREENEEYCYYGRVLRRDGWIVLQYWFFYPFNDWRSTFFGANDHEADWESACIYLYESEDGEVLPEWVAYSAHEFAGDDLRRRWDDPEVEKVGEHPVIYVGAGSHASYYAQGEYLAEVEIPFLAPLVRLVDRMQDVWRRALRLAQGESPPEERPRFNVFRVPFVDYARGDGVSIGPGQGKEWSEPRLISPPPDWVENYRGLWGLYARDPMAGENAPAGPMHGRDGSVRRKWYDPLGWAGLDKVVPPSLAPAEARQRADKLRGRCAELGKTLKGKNAELHRLGVEAAAMRGHFHLEEMHAGHQEKIAALTGEIDGLRRELTEDEALIEALEGYAARMEAGERRSPRAHLRRPQRPVSDEGLRLTRIAEAWAAVSIGLVLIGFVGIVLFAREYLLLGLTILVSVIAFVEAGFRRRLAKLINGLTAALAAVAALVLVFEFFWQIVEIGVLAAGAYIVWENLRELWT